ncbi:unnamed protein product [Rangifer tarandus platyrhynchus]|uniref:Basic proline-rich protein-like n=1 Tax=Rangifer tarandus platyrhynchus TaxID=3082113 RepID=A0ABN8Z3S7_RANTA|nr:unnamed protein product [Rangifer tarandus platyrhynchus]
MDTTGLPGGRGLGGGREAFLKEDVSTPLSLSVRGLLPHQVKIGGLLLELSLSTPDAHFQIRSPETPPKPAFPSPLQAFTPNPAAAHPAKIKGRRARTAGSRLPRVPAPGAPSPPAPRSRPLPPLLPPASRAPPLSPLTRTRELSPRRETTERGPAPFPPIGPPAGAPPPGPRIAPTAQRRAPTRHRHPPPGVRAAAAKFRVSHQRAADLSLA